MRDCTAVITSVARSMSASIVPTGAFCALVAMSSSAIEAKLLAFFDQHLEQLEEHRRRLFVGQERNRVQDLAGGHVDVAELARLNRDRCRP